MQLITINEGSLSEKSYSSKKESLSAMHRIGERYLSHSHESHKLTTDMDGVLIHDDNAIMTARAIAGSRAQEMFGQYADLNIKAVSQGMTSYCWYAPTLFVGQLLQGLSPEINRIVGRHMRLIPKTEQCVSRITENLGYDVVALTAGHQEAAEEVSKRIGITKTIGTQLGISEEGFYDGTVRKFIGGLHKLSAVRDILKYENGSYNGTHIGDSWSDVETLEDVTNSVAFNPGCEPSLRGAKISVIGVSQLGLLPFFDYIGKYDNDLSESDIPQTVIIMNGTALEDDANALLEQSKDVKKRVIEEILTQDCMPLSEVEERIRRELIEQGMEFKSKVTRFMPPEQFDIYAKKAYTQLEQ